MLSHDLVHILACPACKGAVTPLEEENALLCPPCGLKFPVREGIPVMLVDEAEKLGDQGPGTGDRETGI
ncbi:MAG TPA: Trm112 family protein [Desulfuromonadaceae bacterium]